MQNEFNCYELIIAYVILWNSNICYPYVYLEPNMPSLHALHAMPLVL